MEEQFGVGVRCLGTKGVIRIGGTPATALLTHMASNPSHSHYRPKRLTQHCSVGSPHTRSGRGFECEAGAFGRAAASTSAAKSEDRFAVFVGKYIDELL